MTEVTVEEYKLRNGEAYAVSANKSIPSGGGTMNVHIENTSDDVRANVTSISVSSPDGKLQINHPHEFTVDSTGTELAAMNRAVGKNSSSTNVTTYQDSTYSGANHVHTTYAGSGSSGAGTAVGSNTLQGIVSILPGEDLIIELENNGTSARDGSITITYYETSKGEV